MPHVINTPVGKLETSNPWFNRNIVSEVILQDCYKLRKIAAHYHPEILFDIGMGCGQVSMLARSIWRGIKITGFEIDHQVAEEAWKNVPGSMVVTGCVGYSLRAMDIVTRYGFADILACDCESGEVPFFHDLAYHDLLKNFKVIVGEWHFKTAAALLSVALAKDFHFKVEEPTGTGQWGYFSAVNKELPAAASLCRDLGIS